MNSLRLRRAKPRACRGCCRWSVDGPYLDRYVPYYGLCTGTLSEVGNSHYRPGEYVKVAPIFFSVSSQECGTRSTAGG